MTFLVLSNLFLWLTGGLPNEFGLGWKARRMSWPAGKSLNLTQISSQSASLGQVAVFPSHLNKPVRDCSVQTEQVVGRHFGPLAVLVTNVSIPTFVQNLSYVSNMSNMTD